jgi:hypothetical protein
VLVEIQALLRGNAGLEAKTPLTARKKRSRENVLVGPVLTRTHGFDSLPHHNCPVPRTRETRLPGVQIHSEFILMVRDGKNSDPSINLPYEQTTAKRIGQGHTCIATIQVSSWRNWPRCLPGAQHALIGSIRIPVREYLGAYLLPKRESETLRTGSAHDPCHYFGMKQKINLIGTKGRRLPTSTKKCNSRD